MSAPAHLYYPRELQDRISIVLSIPVDEYPLEEAMDHAYSVAQRTKHRMLVYPIGDDLYRIKIGKGPLT